MAAVRRSCRNCSNAIFNERWGEYKCRVAEKKVKADGGKTCRDFKKGTPKVSEMGRDE